MTRHHPSSRHGDRLERVRAHIRANLAGDLSLDRLAGVACLSRFHFHRVWRAATGETVWDAVRRERLARAAAPLAGTDRPLAAVAGAAGFADADALSRAFRQAFGLSPRAMRARGLPAASLLPPRPAPGDQPMTPVTIQEIEPVEVAALPHRGPYPEIGKVFARIDAPLLAAGVPPGQAHAFYYDDPHATPPEELRSHAAVAVPPGADLPDGYERLRTAGGRAAVGVHRGSYRGIPAAWDDTYRWIAAQGEATGDAPPFERYLDNPEDTPEDGLVTEIVVPLRG